MRLSEGFVLAVLMAWPAASHARAQQPIVEDGLKIQAVAKRLASPPDTSPALHWVPDPFPDSSSVLVSNSKVKVEFLKVLTRLAAGEPGCPVWVLEDSQQCTLSDKVNRHPELAPFSFHLRGNVNVIDAPDREGLRITLTLRVDYIAPNPASAGTVQSLAVRVATERERLGGPTTPLTLSARDAAARLGAAPPPARVLDVRITVVVAEADRVRPGGTPFAVESLQDELLRAGLDALRLADDHHLAVNTPAPSDADLTALDENLRLAFRVQRPSWSAVRSSTTHDGDQFTISVTGLRFVSRIQVQVHAPIVEREGGRFTFQGATPAGEAKLVELRAAAAQQAKKALGPDSVEGTLPTQEVINRLLVALRQQRRLGPLDLTSDPDGTITFSAPYVDVDSELTAKADLSASFDPEQLLTGSGKLSGHNLLYLLWKRELREDWDVAASGGPQVQNVSLDFSWSDERGSKHLWTYGVASRLFYSRDANRRIGNLPAVPGTDDTDTQLIDREWGEVPKIFLQYVREGQWHNRLRWEGALDWRDVQIAPHLTTLPAFADGRLTAWDNTIEERLSRDFVAAGSPPRGGIGQLGLQAVATFRNATRQLSGDFAFSRSQLSALVDALFGWSTRREFLARYAWLSGTSADETPAFQLFRLGGSASVRGIEEGEFIGHDLRAHQFTFGVGLPVLIPALAAGSSPLASAYITAIYDRGSVTSGAITHEADGYGVEVELRNLAAGRQKVHLSIGWARSAQSVLHRHGVMTMGVHFSF